jgi:L-iduronidase
VTNKPDPVTARAEIAVDVARAVGEMPRFWRSTGFTPAELLHDPVMQQTLAYLAAMPERAIEYVRIHFLLDLVRVTGEKDGQPVYDWSALDVGLDVLVRNKLKPIFELMGNPSDWFTSYEVPRQIHAWRALVRELAERYSARYGAAEVRAWFFETWNEPDIQYWKHSDAAFLNYYDACSEGLKDADPALKFGGPGTARTLSSTFKALLAHCDTGRNWFTQEQGVRIDFISVHEKGVLASKEDLTPSMDRICDRTAEALAYIRAHHPRLASVPFANDECDPQVGWADYHSWHARPYFAAQVCRLIDMTLRKFVDKGGANPASGGTDFWLLGNDNGFLGAWGQRSQLALFADKALPVGQAYHKTKLPLPGTLGQQQFSLIKKPVLNVMALLALLDGTRATVTLGGAAEDIGALAVLGRDGGIAILVYHSCDRLDRSGAAALSLKIAGVAAGDYMLSHHRIDSAHGDPFLAWEALGGPARPNSEALATMRAQHEVPLLEPPRPVSPRGGMVDVPFTLPLPGVSLLRLTPRSVAAPAVPSWLRAERYRGVDGNEDRLLLWEPVAARSLLTYEVERADDAGGPWVKLNAADILCGAYLDSRPFMRDSYAKHYRVRAVDVWGRAGAFSDAISA